MDQGARRPHLSTSVWPILLSQSTVGLRFLQVYSTGGGFGNKHIWQGDAAAGLRISATAIHHPEVGPGLCFVYSLLFRLPQQKGVVLSHHSSLTLSLSVQETWLTQWGKTNLLRAVRCGKERDKSLILTRKKKKRHQEDSHTLACTRTHAWAHTYTLAVQRPTFFFLMEHDHSWEWNPGLTWYLVLGAKSEP